jgi:peptidoglycan hydrolase FlgJ
MPQESYRFFTVFGQNQKNEANSSDQMTEVSLTRSLPPATPTKRDQALWKAAQQLEVSFLSEMLKSAGLGSPRETFGGGIGEEQFGSFLRNAQAESMVKAGGIGLAESLFETLKSRDNAAV